MSGPNNETPKDTAPRTKGAAETQPAAPSQTAQATAAVSGVVSTVRERLMTGEQIALGAASLIIAVWLIWDLIFDIGTGQFVNVVGTLSLLLAVFMVLAIWVHRWGQYDFGKGYRIVLGALGVSLALFAVTDLLLTFRTDINASASMWLGSLLYWAGGIAAFYGAWLVFRTRDS